MTRRLRWRDRLHNRIFIPIAVTTVLLAVGTLSVTIKTVNETYEDRLTEQLLSQSRLTERALRDLEGRLSFYARSMADAHRLSEMISGSKMASTIPVTMLESLRHDGMTIEYHPRVSPSHPGCPLMRKALLGMAATGLVAKQMPEGRTYFLEGVARVRDGGSSPGIMAVDLMLGDALLTSLRGGRDGSLTVIAQGDLVATTLSDREVVRWIVEQANKPQVMRAVLGEGKYLITSHRASQPSQQLLFTPLVANFENVGMLVYGISLEPLPEHRAHS